MNELHNKECSFFMGIIAKQLQDKEIRTLRLFGDIGKIVVQKYLISSLGDLINRNHR